ncbi:ribitol-5-phosphate xylosyltransferase 1-like [Montipora capricornis]|uniref:ribitol-5-phosphate xylosyltransferase 1-like n=1 Tax=Montipora capricornis TaxID=246305 RepID=UPI0035F1DE1B
MASNKHGRRTCLFRWKIIILFVTSIYFVFTLYAVNVLFLRKDEHQFRKKSSITPRSPTKHHHVSSGRPSAKEPVVDVEIWGKAAIGLYLWEHILEGPLEERLGGVWSFGQKQIQNIRFTFRTGPGVVPGKVPSETRNVILVINGREPKKIEFAKAWLDSLESFSSLRHVAVVLLGNEQCENEWLNSYLETNGGPVQGAFVVYDIPYADSRMFYQWPLGVATYRKFPNVPIRSIDINQPRKYRCNFLGTVYPNSSRVQLKNVIKHFKLDEVCFVKTREVWLPGESSKSTNDFHYALANSDLTLNPVGMNTECYRMYEACSYGSVPVIEDVVTPGKCRKDGMSPLHLLKKYKAPFIYIKDWRELPRIIENEKQLTHTEIVERRQRILFWYKFFKEALRDKFVDVIKKTFSG